MAEKLIAERLITLLDGVDLSWIDVSEGGGQGAYPYCPKTHSLAKRLFEDNNLKQSNTNSYYYDKIKGVKIRVSTHEPSVKHILDNDTGIDKMFVVYTGNRLDKTTLNERLNGKRDKKGNIVEDGVKQVLQKEYGVSMEFFSQIFRTKLTQESVDKLRSMIEQRLGVKWESVKRNSRRLKLTERCDEYYPVPYLGFMSPDGSYLDARDYDTIEHHVMATAILGRKRPSDKNMIDLMQRGYLRFKKENDNSMLILTETQPTRSQLTAIRDVVDLLGNGWVEMSRNGMPKGCIELNRERLDQDMRTLELRLDKTNLPKPKA